MARKIETPDTAAEGLCGGVPYNTELVSISGVAIHFWLGNNNEGMVPTLEAIARRNRDIVGVTYSSGMPSGFWAHQDMR